MSDVGQYLGLLINAVIAAAATGGAVAAFRGLNTWESQAKWQTNSELSRQILVQLFLLNEIYDNHNRLAVFYQTLKSRVNEYSE